MCKIIVVQLTYKISKYKYNTLKYIERVEYMADLKATSFRISEDDLEKFKAFMEKEGIKTQADGFKSIMQSVEMAKAKGQIKDRAKEVETFQDTINKLMGYYLNSLEVNQNSEERIREELSKELSTKDNTISTMYEQLQELKADKSNLESNFKEIESKNKQLQEQLQKANTDNADKNKSIDKLNSNNDLLQEQLQEYKQYKEQYKALEEKLEQLKNDNTTLLTDKTTLENRNKQLQDKLNNNADMLTFYKAEIENKNTSIEGYKADIRALEGTHKQEVAEVKAEHEKALEWQQKALQEQYSSKIDVEVSKKDLEIQKLQNEIEQLKAEKAKQQHKPVNNNIKSK
jgi:chromosome segregation ATPase